MKPFLCYNKNIEKIPLTFDVIGTILIAFAALRVRYRVL